MHWFGIKFVFMFVFGARYISITAFS